MNFVLKKKTLCFEIICSNNFDLDETKAINPMSQYEFGIKCCSFSGPSIPNFLVVVLGGLLAAAIESFGLRLGNGWLLNLCLPHDRRETYH